MKIKLIMVGKTDESYLIQGIEKYIQRLKHYVNFEMITIPVKSDISDIIKLKEAESAMILKHTAPGDILYLLDEKGKQLSSREFAQFFQGKMNESTKSLVFIVGGAFGFSDEMYKRANGKISLSAMTFSHQMIRLFFVEQLYRAFTILKGEKYHND